jgi:hypothetical protein
MLFIFIFLLLEELISLYIIPYVSYTLALSEPHTHTVTMVTIVAVCSVRYALT